MIKLKFFYYYLFKDKAWKQGLSFQGYMDVCEYQAEMLRVVFAKFLDTLEGPDNED